MLTASLDTPLSSHASLEIETNLLNEFSRYLQPVEKSDFCNRNVVKVEICTIISRSDTFFKHGEGEIMLEFYSLTEPFMESSAGTEKKFW